MGGGDPAGAAGRAEEGDAREAVRPGDDAEEGDYCEVYGGEITLPGLVRSDLELILSNKVVN